MAEFDLGIKKSSGWTFETSGSGGASLGGASLGVVAASGGKIVLKSPAGKLEEFYFGGAGVGLSGGVKIPKIGKIEIPTSKGPVGGNVGPTSMPSKGSVYLTGSCEGEELTTSDFKGACAWVELSGGVIAATSVIALLAGMNPVYLPLAINPLSSTVGTVLMVNSAKAVVLMVSTSLGIQAQSGVVGYGGYMW
jgi:hypothetical protein